MHRRVNITLPEETIRLLDRAAPKGNRSRLIAAAVRHYVGARSRALLRRRLRDGAIRRAERDRALQGNLRAHFQEFAEGRETGTFHLQPVRSERERLGRCAAVNIGYEAVADLIGLADQCNGCFERQAGRVADLDA